MEKKHLIVIGGATASGKTQTAIRLCQRINGEVVSCDSMQIYRGMDIGTAKPSEEERQGIAHHMIDIVEPNQSFSVFDYAQQGSEVIERILSKGKTPVLCGGTGLYIDALTRPMAFSGINDESIRSQLRLISEKSDGKHMLHKRLQEIDPLSAERLHENDVRRVIRAIEVYLVTGKTMTEHMVEDAAREVKYHISLFALYWDRTDLFERINRRADKMMADGLIDEVQKLLRNGVSMDATSMQALGYKEIAAFLLGKTTLEKAIYDIKIRTRHYAKRQVTWLNRDGRTKWIPAAGKTADELCSEIIEETDHETD